MKDWGENFAKVNELSIFVLLVHLTFLHEEYFHY